jgi:hypothetical protein
MKLIDLLKEIGDATARPYDWRQTADEEDFKQYLFQTDSDLKYELEISVSEGDKELDSAVVAFGIVEAGESDYFTDYDKVPSKGELYKVMATTVSILKDFIKKNKQIKYIYFTTNKLGNDTSKDRSSRLGLYTKYIQKHIPNAKIDTKVVDGQESTMIKLKELNVPKAEDAYKFIDVSKTRLGPVTKYEYTFKNKKGDLLDVNCNVTPNTREEFGSNMYVSFGIEKEKSGDEDKKYGVKTGSNDMLKVMATVVDAIRRTMKQEGEETIFSIKFRASDDKRERIYNYYIQSLFPKFRKAINDDPRFTTYVNTEFKK